MVEELLGLRSVEQPGNLEGLAQLGEGDSLWRPRDGVRRSGCRFALAGDGQDASFRHLMRTSGYRLAPDPSPLICVGPRRRSPVRARTTRTTRRRSPELGNKSQAKTTMSRCELRMGRGQPAQRPTIPQNGATLNLRIPDGRALAGVWLPDTHAGHQIEPLRAFRQGFRGCLARLFNISAPANSQTATLAGYCAVGVIQPHTPSWRARATSASYSSAGIVWSRVRM